MDIEVAYLAYLSMVSSLHMDIFLLSTGFFVAYSLWISLLPLSSFVSYRVPLLRTITTGTTIGTADTLIS